MSTHSHPLIAVGLTQASRVIALARSSVLESATVTQLFVPLNDRALPNFPPADQVAFEIVPVFPLPEASPSVEPVPSSKLYAATRVFDVETVTVTPAEGVSRLPLSSAARVLMVALPAAFGVQV